MIYTTSQLACYKSCTKKWFYRFLKMLDPIHQKKSLQLGSYVHHMLDQWYNSYDEVFDLFAVSAVYFNEKTKDIFEEEASLFADIRDEAEQIAERYILKYQEDLSKYHVLSTETEFSIPIYSPTGRRTKDIIMGKFDMIVKDMFDTTWFFEHKTTADSVDNRFETIELEEQLNNYIMVASMLYDNFGGGVLNVIRKKAPRFPEPLKSGKGLSQAKNIDTTFDVYMRAIRFHKYNVADYQEILGILKEKGDRFFGRKIVSRKPQQILETRNEIYYTVQQIKNQTKMYNKTKDESTFFRCPNFMCSSCQYVNLCILDSEKGDVDGYIAGNFNIRESVNPEISLESQETK